ncbi:MAG: hypothetical protein A3C93_02875 [Candidatus Lloydbacteria bacterium RIFCSPHIGHO2_02_FULL_54_17]|uniref:UDP-N-acetylmuramate--L-alanine ligase n=1 Tax=Candidatus Lloydbacteria bacterium RIFCSPHIGHO2_02_FULL_54_17 TaxID=1798664 RepID=A0A1G2DAG7_9BACT|nr:MAG: hypothetical protein A2762_04745 [Candidatus Lloydbacteria bacterium RIFCSPHIGHO2_01_FULL_54_11]OGZ10615.1 MAG: hypothetical protein A3C93_02875 [Candidatus Lloydbacteria bacterium RIFCSPHIGHO2_02_FULL_54_17]OGZ13650.1 MAG: hypothetical protein A2948_03065 [Candidatus Lloydbacteria bacterium RIFCSPLOWO2_01_FULL_54_18]OGZ16088.1 MAG: hypothetical protein A3H76_01520 [Candidatus Lloydbacteria bacterium RIFCSPLOWO2_02_FULL_54_12]
MIGFVDLTHIKKAYFIGVGGIGVSALVRLFASRGIEIVGSDIHLPPKESLPHGIYFEGADAEHVPHDTGVLIYSPAVPEMHVERARAREYGISELSYPEALAEVTRPYNTIAVSGTHGKSTTTALLGKLFEAGGLDPSVIVGAEIAGWDHNLRIGGGNPPKNSRAGIFVVEACEYRRNMMHLSPQTILLTNLELDHPDYYQDLADIKSAFHDYITKAGNEGLLVVNNDDANIRDIIRNFDGSLVRYGVGGGADLIARNIKQAASEQSFDLVWKGTPLGVFATPLPGLYNIYNILGAVAVYLAYGGKTEAIQGTLSDFHGASRRFEVLGTLGRATVIADYAHHPTALKAVVDATLFRYQGKRVLAIFRPHHRERTKKLFDQFVQVIAAIPHMLLVEIYDVAGREPRTIGSADFPMVRGGDALPISSKDLVMAVKAKNPAIDLTYVADLPEAEETARARAGGFDVILVIGAGDVDELAKRLVDQSQG